MKDDLYVFGADARRDIGEKTDAHMLAVLEDSPGLSIYELSKKLDWTTGKVSASIDRLVKSGRAKVEYVAREGKVAKLVYPANYVPQEPGIIRIPVEMVEDYHRLIKKVWLYAISRTTIGLSPRRVREWDRRALAVHRLEPKVHDGDLIVKIPEKLTRFYSLGNATTSLSSIGNTLLLTVEASFLPIEARSPRALAELDRASRLEEAKELIKFRTTETRVSFTTVEYESEIVFRKGVTDAERKDLKAGGLAGNQVVRPISFIKER